MEIIDAPSEVIAEESHGVYFDETIGKRISTNSMLKTFRRCPKQADFKYARRLKPRRIGSPLKRGKWVHDLLEAYHNGQDWRALHQKHCTEFNQMFDEEKEHYGDLPTEILSVMEAYIWHYKYDTWIIHETEFTIETEFPDGTLFRGKVDALIENDFGLFLVDHKTHASLPDRNFRLLDTQSALYIWAALRNQIPVQGFIWNYLRWKAPTIPHLNKNGTLSKAAIDTDYPTYTKALKQYQADGLKILPEHVERQRYLKRLQYRPGQPQESSFFQRTVLERDPAMLRRMAAENFHTSKRMHAYDFSNPVGVERVVERSCSFSCSYVDLCTAELMGANVDKIIKQNYTLGDPNDYYQDRGGDTPERESRF